MIFEFDYRLKLWNSVGSISLLFEACWVEDGKKVEGPLKNNICEIENPANWKPTNETRLWVWFRSNCSSSCLPHLLGVFSLYSSFTPSKSVPVTRLCSTLMSWVLILIFTYASRVELEGLYSNVSGSLIFTRCRYRRGRSTGRHWIWMPCC